MSDVTLDDALFLLSLPRMLRRRTPAIRLCHGRYGFYVERDPETILGRATTRSLRGRGPGVGIIEAARTLTASGAEALFGPRAPPPGAATAAAAASRRRRRKR